LPPLPPLRPLCESEADSGAVESDETLEDSDAPSAEVLSDALRLELPRERLEDPVDPLGLVGLCWA
jgi:hypothetical protein